MSDNLIKIEEEFFVSNGSEWAGGWGWKCKHCNTACFSEEGFFPCQNEFIPIKIKCENCGRVWKLKIIPDDIETQIIQ